MLWSRYCPSLYETGMVSTATGFLDFVSYMSAALASTIFTGLVKHIGFSFHDTADVLDKGLAAHPEAEFVQLQINYKDWDDERVQSEKCYNVARAHGKEIIIMEPVKGGMLAGLAPEAEAIFKECSPKASVASFAIRYAASLEGVLTVLSGMSNYEQTKDNAGYMKDFEPLSEKEKDAVERVRECLKALPTVQCTGCSYCTDGCPAKIKILIDII
jgi:predicted aldo/keto reductase-like oxidoreductase